MGTTFSLIANKFLIEDLLFYFHLLWKLKRVLRANWDGSRTQSMNYHWTFQELFMMPWRTLLPRSLIFGALLQMRREVLLNLTHPLPYRCGLLDFHTLALIDWYFFIFLLSRLFQVCIALFFWGWCLYYVLLCQCTFLALLMVVLFLNLWWGLYYFKILLNIIQG